MPTIVRSGGSGGMDVSAANATTSQVLSGATFYSNASDDIQTGTMINHGAKQINVGDTGSTGYYSSISVNASSLGNATAAHVLSNATFTNTSKKTQAGSIVIRSDPEGTVGVNGTYKNTNAGYYSSITVTGPTFNESTGSASDILSGKKFYSNIGTVITGTMTNKGSVSTSVGVGGSYSDGAGYYSGINISGPSFTESTGSASDVLSGKKFYSNTGALVTGSMTNRGSVTKTISPGGSWTGAAGYYSGITISASTATTTGNATNSEVLYGYTYMNSSGAQTGSLRLYRYKGDITTSWMEIDLGWTPTYYGATTSPGYGENARTKCYLSGTTLYVCHNGSSTWNGRIIAST